MDDQRPIVPNLEVADQPANTPNLETSLFSIIDSLITVKIIIPFI